MQQGDVKPRVGSISDQATRRSSCEPKCCGRPAGALLFAGRRIREVSCCVRCRSRQGWRIEGCGRSRAPGGAVPGRQSGDTVKLPAQCAPATVARPLCVCRNWQGIQGDLRGTTRAKPAGAPRGYASGRSLHLAVRSPHEVDPIRTSHGCEPVAAQHGDSRRRSWFERIAGSKCAELVILDGLLHRGFTRNLLRHDHTFTTTLRSQEFVVQTRPPALHAVRAAGAGRVDHWLAHGTVPSNPGACSVGGRWGTGRAAGQLEQPAAGAPSKHNNTHRRRWLGWVGSGFRPHERVLVARPN